MPARQRRAVEAEATADGAIDGFVESGGASIVPLHGAAPAHGTALGNAVPEGVDADHWRAICGSAPWLTISDVLPVKALCHALGEYEQARAHVEEHGVMVMAKAGDLVPNPWYSVLERRRAEVVKLAREVGLTPMVRMQARK